MDTVEEKIKSLDYRIGNVTKQMDDLLQTKINLMMIKREINMKEVRTVLTDSFDKTIKEDIDD
jgi:hypothetical protein